MPSYCTTSVAFYLLQYRRMCLVCAYKCITPATSLHSRSVLSHCHYLHTSVKQPTIFRYAMHIYDEWTTTPSHLGVYQTFGSRSHLIWFWYQTSHDSGASHQIESTDAFCVFKATVVIFLRILFMFIVKKTKSRRKQQKENSSVVDICLTRMSQCRTKLCVFEYRRIWMWRWYHLQRKSTIPIIMNSFTWKDLGCSSPIMGNCGEWGAMLFFRFQRRIRGVHLIRKYDNSGIRQFFVFFRTQDRWSNTYCTRWLFLHKGIWISITSGVLVWWKFGIYWQQ